MTEVWIAAWFLWNPASHTSPRFVNGFRFGPGAVISTDPAFLPAGRNHGPGGGDEHFHDAECPGDSGFPGAISSRNAVCNIEGVVAPISRKPHALERPVLVMSRGFSVFR